MGNCQKGMVFVKGGQYKGQTISDLCVVQHEFTNTDNVRVIAGAKDSYQLWNKIVMQLPNFLTRGIANFYLAVSKCPTSTSSERFDGPDQPMVNVSGYHASALCEAQGMRLLTPLEWEYVASQGGTKKYSTRSGELDSGVHSNADATRKVCEATGHYIEFEGKEICDMNGNVWEWVLDPSGNYYIFGGSWHYLNYSWYLQADSRRGINPVYSSYNDVGFRCGMSAQ